MSIYIIAEAGVNHNGDIKLARELIHAAAEAGADAVKFQTFSADNLVTADAPKADYQKETTGGDGSQYDMLKKLELPRDAYYELTRTAEKCGIEFLSTPFDEESADFLEKLGMRIFKISSGELTNHPFLKHIALKDREIILSTGMASEKEVEDAVAAVFTTGNCKLTLLECTSCYPAHFEDVNLLGIQYLKEKFGVKSGYSDHTPGTEAAVAAAALGADVIEKHFTLDKTLPGPDHRMSLNPEELAVMVRQIRNVELALGGKFKKVSESEKRIARAARRSIFYKTEIRAGVILTPDMVEFKRPGTGVSPAELESFTGRKLAKDIIAGTMLNSEDFE
jgi:N-acetylneuraminate synthase